MYTFLMWQALLSPFMWQSENVKSQDIQMCSDSWLGQIDVSKAIRSETYLFSTHFWSLDSDFYIFHLEICCVAIPLYDDMLIAIVFIYKPLHVLRQTRLMEFVFRPQITSRVGQLTFVTFLKPENHLENENERLEPENHLEKGNHLPNLHF